MFSVIQEMHNQTTISSDFLLPLTDEAPVLPRLISLLSDYTGQAWQGHGAAVYGSRSNTLPKVKDTVCLEVIPSVYSILK